MELKVYPACTGPATNDEWNPTVVGGKVGENVHWPRQKRSHVKNEVLFFTVANNPSYRPNKLFARVNVRPYTMINTFFLDEKRLKALYVFINKTIVSSKLFLPIQCHFSAKKKYRKT